MQVRQRDCAVVHDGRMQTGPHTQREAALRKTATRYRQLHKGAKESRMGTIINYVCPVHPRVVLFTGDSDVCEYVIVERPETCPKCNKSYYKSECTPQRGESKWRR